MSDDRFHARYVKPPPPPDPDGKIIVDPPCDSHGRALCPVLHLTIEQAYNLIATLREALEDFDTS